MLNLNKDSKSVLQKLVVISLFIFSNGCVSSPNVDDVGRADIIHIESKALIEDKAKSESNTVNIDLFYKQNSAFRLEVSAMLGIQLGSLVMIPNQISYLLHQQKVFVVGPVTTKTTRPLFKHEIDPKILWALVFDRDLAAYGFKCRISDKITECVVNEKSLSTTVTKETKDNGLKKMVIENSVFRFVWIYKTMKKHNMSYNETFVLKKPEEYRLITIK